MAEKCMGVVVEPASFVLVLVVLVCQLVFFELSEKSRRKERLRKCQKINEI